MSLIHRYQSNGYNIVLDINSGCIHLVDLVTYEVLPFMEEGLSETEIVDRLKDQYPEADIRTSVSECGKLKEQGMLFTRDVYENIIEEFTENRQTVVKALCLHIAHDCNLACRYCFAEEGEYHGRRALMSFEVGKKALDFLIANSGSRKNLEVDFFGGEPLMNWQVVKDLVAYGREQEKLHNKKFRFTLTTNGVLLNDEVMEFCNKEMGNVVLSVDGRKEVHDYMRPFRKGAGSYDLIISNPPYITTEECGKLMPEVKDHEPMLALDGKEDGLYFYKKIIKEAKNYLNPDGMLAFEIGYDQGEAVKNLMEAQDFDCVEIKKDLAGLDRLVFGFAREGE